jgi:hypothetical protein
MSEGGPGRPSRFSEEDKLAIVMTEALRKMQEEGSQPEETDQEEDS